MKFSQNIVNKGISASERFGCDEERRGEVFSKQPLDDQRHKRLLRVFKLLCADCRGPLVGLKCPTWKSQSFIRNISSNHKFATNNNSVYIQDAMSDQGELCTADKWQLSRRSRGTR